LGRLDDLYGQNTTRLRKYGRNISTVASADSGRTLRRFRIPAAAVPLPGVARVVLILLGGRDLGSSDKTAFEIAFNYKNTPCIFALRKFGTDLQAWIPDGANEDDETEFIKEFLSELRRLISIAENDVFEPSIKIEVDKGEFTLSNNAGPLRGQYKYFREGAVLGFGKEGRLQAFQPTSAPANTGLDAVVQELVHANWLAYRAGELASREGSYNASAMVNSFFSYLEHYLSLAVAFINFDVTRFDLLKFLGDSWSAKFKTVVDVATVKEAKLIYDRLARAAEIYRNPLAHGGWDKRGPSASVFLDGVGRVPLMISGFEKTVGFTLNAFDPESFEDLCALFDETEDLLGSAALGHSSEWIKSGLDVFFEPAARQKYRSSDEVFRVFLDFSIEGWEREMNMD
jgi:hypothetical protein